MIVSGGKPEVKEETEMKGTFTMHQVAGKQYKVWSDFMARGTFAEDENGTIKKLCGSGYIHNDLTVRKAIACVFGLPTFRK